MEHMCQVISKPSQTAPITTTFPPLATLILIRVAEALGQKTIRLEPIIMGEVKQFTREAVEDSITTTVKATRRMSPKEGEVL